MKDDILVSVAVITYNQVEFIEDCLESILSQDYSNIEIIVADDGSTDGTQKILREFQHKNPEKIKLFLSETNQGITINSNIAHFNCKGKYIAWIGGDDLMLPGKIRSQVEYFETHPECSICYHNLEVFDSDSGEILYISNTKKNSHQGKINMAVRYSTFNGACASMVRSSSTPETGFDVRIPVASDWLYWIESLADGGEIHYIDKILGKYRKHSRNISTTNVIANLTDHILSCNIVLIKYPRLRKDVFYRMSWLYRHLAKHQTSSYLYYLRTSIKLKATYKNVLALLIYIISFKRIRM